MGREPRDTDEICVPYAWSSDLQNASSKIILRKIQNNIVIFQQRL